MSFVISLERHDFSHILSGSAPVQTGSGRMSLTPLRRVANGVKSHAVCSKVLLLNLVEEETDMNLMLRTKCCPQDDFQSNCPVRCEHIMASERDLNAPTACLFYLHGDPLGRIEKTKVQFQAVQQ